MKIECPHCKQHYEVDEQYVAEIIVCQICNTKFQVDCPKNDVRTQGYTYGQTCMEKIKIIFKSVMSRSTLLISIVSVIAIVMCVIATSLNKQMIILRKDIKSKAKIISSLHENIKTKEHIIDVLKYGAKRLSLEAEAAVKDGELDKARLVYEELFKRHPHEKYNSVYRTSYNNIVSLIEKDKKLKEKQRAAREAVMLANIVKEHDYMQSITWYQTKRDCKYVTQKGKYDNFPDEYYYIELYVGQSDDKKNKLLRLRTRYYTYGKSKGPWIFYDKVQIKGSNGSEVFIATTYPEKKTEVGDGSLKEWADNNVNDIAKELTKIAESSSIFVKFYGKYPFEFNMTGQQTAAFKEIIARYNSL